MLAWLVLGGFAGLRTDEIERLDWSDIDFEHGSIDIRPEVSKTGSGRDVKLEEDARDWLFSIRKATGPVVRKHWHTSNAVRQFKQDLANGNAKNLKKIAAEIGRPV